ncbi:macrophage mannose receptor 1 [Biomphalaria glabrata]|nr:macrophage mannose receptor 1-like [Biomphalaria glabrata]
MFSMFTLVCYLATAFTPSVQSQIDLVCPPTLPQDDYRQLYSDVCFYFVLFRQSEYLAAQNHCENLGGSLVLVKSPELEEFIVSQMVSTYHQPHAKLWIGLDDLDRDKVFTWRDGSLLDYSNWAVGEGLGKNPGEECAVLDVGQRGRWYDYRCNDEEFSSYEQQYVCQFGSMSETTLTAEAFTVTVTSLTHPCPPFSCDLDCGMDGFKMNPLDGCAICQCEME